MIRTMNLCRAGFLSSALMLGVVPTAAALSASTSSECRAQAKALKAEQAEALEKRTQRDELLVEVEAAGDEWEAAEAVRLFGANEASKADIAKADYHDRRSELTSLEADLQSTVTDLNRHVAAYNTKCVKK